MLNNALYIMFLMAADPAVTAGPLPLECVYAATSFDDEQLIGGLAARGGGQQTEIEAAAVKRLMAADKGCRKANGWSADKTKTAVDYARAKFLYDYGKQQLTQRSLPIGPVEKTYARLAPEARTALMAGAADSSVLTILTEELKKAKLKPSQVGREEGRLMGNMLVAKALADKAQTAFDTTR